MNKIPKEKRLRTIVCKGLPHLHEQLQYGQSNVVKKFATLGYQLSPSSLNNIKNDKPVGLPTLNLAAKAMELLLQRELDLAFDPAAQDFRPQNTPGWQATVVPEKPEGPSAEPMFRLHPEGRVELDKKTAFIRTATREVVEIGVRLHSFSRYFISHNDNVYKTHILALLQRGVHFKGYLLDPDSNEARLYFDDRARVQGHEKDAIGDTKKVIEHLRQLCKEFAEMNLAGKLEIFLYQHIPYGFFFAVDGATEQGKMMVSPYLYGVRRANCPVLEFSRQEQPVLYRKYWESMQLFLDGARSII